MMLEMVHHLAAVFALNRSILLIFCVFLYWCLTHCSFLLLFPITLCKMTETCKFYTITNGVPLEVKHRVNWLDFNPPATRLQCIPDKPWVVSIADNELVAVFHVGILERYLANSSFEHVSVFSTQIPTLLLANLRCIVEHVWWYAPTKFVDDLDVFGVDYNSTHRGQVVLNGRGLLLLVILVHFLDTLRHYLIISLLHLYLVQIRSRCLRILVHSDQSMVYWHL